MLLTESNLMKRLDALDAEHAALQSRAKESSMQLEVTQMNSNKLTVEIKVASRCGHRL